MTDPDIKPDVRAFLRMLEANPRPVMTAELLSQIRTMPADAMSSADLPVGELATIRNVTLPGPGGDIAARLYDPRVNRQAGPVVVFFHGGGFIVGSIDTHAAIAAEIARQFDLPVISVEYRLAPEHPWPAAPDDAEAAIRWIAENGAAFDRDFSGLILCGDSAGGNLAIVSALALRDRPAALPVLLQIALYPATDRTEQTESRKAFAGGYGIEAREMALYDGHYRSDKSHWRASPALADQHGMPPSLIVTAAFDPLRDGGRAYAAQLVAAGVPTTYREVPGTIHGFASYRRAIPSAATDLDRILREAAAIIRALPAEA